MPDLLHMHWLWIFGALWFGIALGWASYRLAGRWTVRPAHVAIGAATAAVLLAIAHLLPARYGYRLEVGVVLAIVAAIGAFVGWALRDIAEYTPAATRPGASALAASTAAAPAGGPVTGTYLFRDALAGTGGGSPYMRTTRRTGQAGPARVRPVPSAASLARAPAPGGYTFPKTLPFADATTSRRQDSATGPRRHWSW